MPNSPWDERSVKEQKRVQSLLLRQTVLQMALGHVPYVRARLASMGLDARVFKGLEELYRLPLTMRRDIVDPKRNPEGMRGVLLQGTPEGLKRFSDRKTLRRVARARMLGGEEMYDLAIEAATRPIHLHLADGPGGRIPVGYTRDDLDLLARAGARLGQVSGVERADRLLNLVPFGPSIDFWGVFYMAHGLGVTAVHARREDASLDEAIAVFDDARPTVLVVAADEATVVVGRARDAGMDLTAVKTVLAVGRSLTADERTGLGEDLLAAGAQDARIAAAYAPAEGRVLWGECSVPAGRAETFGFHTFPDMDLVETISPETGKPVDEQVVGEIVLTTLGFRGGGVPRWRTGDLALGGMTSQRCPNCGRTVPRVGPTVVRRAWERTVSLNGSSATLDLRDPGAAAAERADLWQVELVSRPRGDELFVHLEGDGRDPLPVIELYQDLVRLGAPPTQIVLGAGAEVEARIAEAPGPWPRFVERSPGKPDHAHPG